jgi:hypothetical protein
MRSIALAALAVLIGCASPTSSTVAQPAGPPARIDLARALARHPFAPVLAQYNADIATLRRATGDVALRNVHQLLVSSAVDVEHRLQISSARARELRAQPIQPLPAAAAESRRDFSGGVIGAFAQAAQSRVARAVDLRAAQLREHEATAAYDYERAHAGRRLVLGLKLRDLHLDASNRRRYQTQVDALDRQEMALLDAERARDAGILAAYGSQLRAQANADAVSMASDLANHARAMRAIPQPQMRALPNSLRHPADSRAATLAAFADARHDLTDRWNALRGMDDAARADAAREISELERQRDVLRAQIVTSIEARAARIAATQRLGKIYTVDAPREARDITDAVVRSYSVSTGS